MRKSTLSVLFMVTILVTGCTGGHGKELQDSLFTEPDSTFLPNGYDVMDLFKTTTGHITTTITVNGRPCFFLIDTGGGATLIDKSKKQKYSLTSSRTSDYAAGISSRTSLVRTQATFQINGQDIKVDDLYLMDISYINNQFKKNHASQVDGVLGTDFLAKYGAVIDYAQSKLYIKIR